MAKLDLLIGKQVEVRQTLTQLKQSIHHIQQYRDVVSKMIEDLDSLKVAQQITVNNIEKHLM